MKSILLVDDDEVVRDSVSFLLRTVGFKVTCAVNAPEALRLIASNPYDVLLTDLHMPAPGDGLTVVGAMRQAHPKAVTLLLTSFPEMDVAAKSIVRQADEILVKPMNIRQLVETINRRIADGARPEPAIESVAAILEVSVEAVIQTWFERVQNDEILLNNPMSRADRTSHLPDIIHDLADRLRSGNPLGGKGRISTPAHRHGALRRTQGYSIPMIVEESRLLQVSIFDTLQRNLACIDFSCLLLDVMTIADEVDSQLKQAIEGFLVLTPELVPTLD